MAIARLQVFFDALTAVTRKKPTTTQDFTIGGTKDESTLENCWIEPIKGILMRRPIQFRTKAGEGVRYSTILPRYPIANWMYADGTDVIDYWQDVKQNESTWLLGPNAAGGFSKWIKTRQGFKGDVSFFFRFVCQGVPGDSVTGFSVRFGQWQLNIYTDGKIELYHQTVRPTEKRMEGNISAGAGHSLIGNEVKLSIMVIGNSLLIQRNGVTGFYYDLVLDDWIYEDNWYWVSKKEKFSVYPAGCKLRFELTPMMWDLEDSYYISPTYWFPRPPEATDTIAVTLNDNVYTPSWNTGVATGSLITLPVEGSPAFAADGASRGFAIKIALTPSTDSASGHGTASPAVSIVRVVDNPSDSQVDALPAEATDDVIRVTLSAGQDATGTEAVVEMNNPEAYDLFGHCNSALVLKLGDAVIFKGVLREPPQFVQEGLGKSIYKVTAQTYAKYLNEQCLLPCVFDGVPHSTAIQTIIDMAGIKDADFEVVDSGDKLTLLPTTQKLSGEDGQPQYNFASQSGDRAYDLITSIADSMGWMFTDAMDDSRNLKLQYVDPLTFTTTPIHYFVFKSSDEGWLSGSDYPYRRIYSWSVGSQEPIATWFRVLGMVGGVLQYGGYPNNTGLNIAAEDPDILPMLRTDDWLGVRREVQIPWHMDEANNQIAETTLDHLQRLAYRMGREFTRRWDIAEFEADWPCLWRNDCIQVYDSTLDKVEGVDQDTGYGLYRILSITDIKFENESDTNVYPLRRAKYQAVRIA